MKLIHRLPAVPVALFLAACATNMDMVTLKERVDAAESRVGHLERALAPAAPASAKISPAAATPDKSAGETEAKPAGESLPDRLAALEAEVKAQRKTYADQQSVLQEMAEKLENFRARLSEVESAMAQQQKRGVTVDRSLEHLATKLEAELKVLGDQIRKLLGPPAKP